METIFAISSVLIIKLTAMVAGYKIVSLGHDALVKGLKGEFLFTSNLAKDRGMMLKGASPGLLFVLLGSLLIGWAIYIDKPIAWNNSQNQPIFPRIHSQPDLPNRSAK